MSKKKFLALKHSSQLPQDRITSCKMWQWPSGVSSHRAGILLSRKKEGTPDRALRWVESEKHEKERQPADPKTPPTEKGQRSQIHRLEGCQVLESLLVGMGIGGIL